MLLPGDTSTLAARPPCQAAFRRECARYLRPSPLSGVRLIMVISYALVMSSALRSDPHPVGEGRNPPSNGIRWPDTLIPCRAAWGLYWRVEGAIWKGQPHQSLRTWAPGAENFSLPHFLLSWVILMSTPPLHPCARTPSGPLLLHTLPWWTSLLVQGLPGWIHPFKQWSSRYWRFLHLLLLEHSPEFQIYAASFLDVSTRIPLLQP